MQKFLKGCFALFILIYLSGCGLFEPKTDDGISFSKDLSVKDIASEYTFDAATLKVYTYDKDPHTSYVNIEEFIEILEGGLVELKVSKGRNLTLTHRFEVPEDEEGFVTSFYSAKISISPNKNTISYSDIDLLYNMNVAMETEYESERVQYQYMEYVEGTHKVTIDLDPYGFDLLYEEDSYYMPLYLANMFLAGQYVHVYEMKDSLYIFDDFSDLTELVNRFESDDTKKALNVAADTENFLALYFDYFYGLKDFKGIDSYQEVLKDYAIDEATTYEALNKEIDRFLGSHNDLHSSIVTAGYMDPEFIPLHDGGDKSENFLSSYMDNACFNVSEELTSGGFEDIFVLQVNGFSFDTKDHLKLAMEEAKSYEEIIIDLRCNTGGALVGMLELASYLTDEDIQISYINPLTETKIAEVYEVNGEKYPKKNFYVLTSKTTFSAANLFASFVKDRELGILLGQDTSGGASAIQYMVLPTGAIIVTSSNFTFMNENEVIIEDGIQVDFSSDEYLLYDYVVRDYNYIEKLGKFRVDYTNKEDSLLFDVHRESTHEDLNIIDYQVDVMDEFGLVQSFHFTEEQFALATNFVNPYRTYSILVHINYEFHGVNRSNLLLRFDF